MGQNFIFTKQKEKEPMSVNYMLTCLQCKLYENKQKRFDFLTQKSKIIIKHNQ